MYWWKNNVRENKSFWRCIALILRLNTKLRRKTRYMSLQGNTVFSCLVNTDVAWKGAGKGRENTQERRATRRMRGRTLKEWVKGIHVRFRSTEEAVGILFSQSIGPQLQTWHSCYPEDESGPFWFFVFRLISNFSRAADIRSLILAKYLSLNSNSCIILAFIIS